MSWQDGREEVADGARQRGAVLLELEEGCLDCQMEHVLGRRGGGHRRCPVAVSHSFWAIVRTNFNVNSADLELRIG